MADATQDQAVADVLAVDASVQTATGAAGYGLTPTGFVPKPFARLLAEKLALARLLFGDGVDLTSGSAVRKLMEVTALEDARTWSALAATYDNCFLSSATGAALSQLGRELGLERPFLEARGAITLKLTGALPAGLLQVRIPRGARLSSAGGHHVSLDETVVLSATAKQRDVGVTAFFPGASHNLNPAVPGQALDRFNRLDPALEELNAAERLAGAPLVAIEHTLPLTGGDLQWPDARYRDLLLRAPRSVWTTGSIQTAVSLVPGVRQCVVRDPMGGLDINQSIFGNFSFLERVFGTERDLGSPYYFGVLVAPTPAAIWDGPGGLRASVDQAIQDLRPIGIFPQIQEAEQVAVGVRARLVVEGLPLPTGGKAAVNASAAAVALKERLLIRVGRYIDGLRFGEPVRAAEVVWSIMNEPGVADVLDLHLVRFPATFESLALGAASPDGVLVMGVGQNVTLQAAQIAVFVDDPSGLEII
ncbi:baseplate J/gp47 family protein [Aquisphaera insulae]|uniref:baseplate J/gp47 family protein n=1 Tax=Aquisphaera insulae TaxID=2712864 RepID=UPI0013EB62CB|nr:baseplate J/gp47 family protein [Aquisphaera insulae]